MYLSVAVCGNLTSKVLLCGDVYSCSLFSCSQISKKQKQTKKLSIWSIVVNSVVMYEEQLTQKYFKTKQFFFVGRCGECMWPNWTRCEIFVGKTFALTPNWMVWISIGMNGFCQRTSNRQSFYLCIFIIVYILFILTIKWPLLKRWTPSLTSWKFFFFLCQEGCYFPCLKWCNLSDTLDILLTIGNLSTNF